MAALREHTRFLLVCVLLAGLATLSGCGSHSTSHTKSWQDGYAAAPPLAQTGNASQCESAISAASAAGYFSGNTDQAVAGCEQWFTDNRPGTTDSDGTSTSTAAAPAPHGFDVSDCVKRWNRLDYGSIVPNPEPTIPEISVSVESPPDRVCAYEGPLSNAVGSTYAYFLIAEGGDQSPQSIRESEPILETDGPSQSYSPNYAMVNGQIVPEGTSGATAQSQAEQGSSSVGTSAPQETPSPSTSASPQTTSPTNSLSTVTGHAYSVEVPSAWDVESHEVVHGDLRTDGYWDTAIESPDGNALIRVDTNPGRENVAPAASAQVVLAYLEHQPGYRLISWKPETFDGAPALRWEFADVEHGVTLHKIDLFVGDVALLFQAPETTFDTYREIYKSIIDTFVAQD